jgi:predicted  nucleic acid-binding Zn-ribbon protein
MQPISKILLALPLMLVLGPRALAGEADDLQRMIEVARQGAKDLERLDAPGAVRDEVTTLNIWLDNAWKLRAQQKYDEVRVVMDRVQAQGEMIHEKITASQLSRDAAAKEGELKRVRAEIARTREAMQAAAVQKAALEGRQK